MEEKIALSKYAELCSKSEHCEFDIREKMRKTDLDDDAQDRIIAYLRKEKFIDDHRYAEIYVRDKVRFNGWGPQKLRFELSHRHINSDAIEDALGMIEDDEYEEQLEKALRSKLRQSHTDDKMKLKASLMRFGGSRGFAFDLVASMVNRLLSEL